MGCIIPINCISGIQIPSTQMEGIKHDPGEEQKADPEKDSLSDQTLAVVVSFFNAHKD